MVFSRNTAKVYKLTVFLYFFAIAILYTNLRLIAINLLLNTVYFTVLLERYRFVIAV